MGSLSCIVSAIGVYDVLSNRVLVICCPWCYIFLLLTYEQKRVKLKNQREK